MVGAGAVDPLTIVIFLIAVAISTAILVTSLFLVEDIKASSFKELGAAPTLARSAGIVVAATLVGLIPYGIILQIIAWFVGIMILFQKTFVQTLFLTILNNIISLGVLGALKHLMA